MTSMPTSRESGAVLALTAVMLVGLLGITALVIDGGVLFAARRDLQAIADGAARAGAMALDEQLLRDTDVVRLNPTAARNAASRYLEVANFDGDVSIDADVMRVTVGLRESRPTLLMGLLGVRDVDVAAHAVARPRIGIEEAGG